MEITFNLITLVFLVAFVLGIVSSIIIFYFAAKANPANQPLAIGQLSISLASLVGFALVSKLILQWPFLYRLGHVFALIFIPMPYLYVLFYTKNRHWKWRDLLHAIPLVVFLVDYQHVLLMSNAEKLVIIKQEVNDLNVLGQFRQSRFFGIDFHERFRTALLSFYWVAEVLLLVKWLKSQTVLSPQNKVWKNWILLFLGCQFFMWAPFYLSFFGFSIMTTYHIVNSFSVGWILVSSLSLFFFPSLLYGKVYYPENGKKKRASRKTDLAEGATKKWEEVMTQMETQMELNLLFLKPGYSINDLSKDIEVPVYQISKSLNSIRGLTFMDFLNQKRIQHCIAQFEKGEWLNLTLEAIALECGFSNRNSFTKAFQKFQGQSPSEYRLRLA